MDNNTCPFCESPQPKLHHPVVWNRPESKVYRCEHCDLIYLYPAMSEDEEKAFYLNYNQHVLSRLDDGTHSMAAQFEAALHEGVRRASAVKRFLNPSMRVLEIGSATGAFLFLIRDAVQEVLGVEPSRAHAAHMVSLGIPHVSDIGDLGMAHREKFHGIALFHVLEHIRSPRSYLTLLRRAVPGAGRVSVDRSAQLLVPLLIFILLWKRRSTALLPLVMVFPWAAILACGNVGQIARDVGDYYQIIRLTGLPEAGIIIPGLVTLVLGIFFFLSLLTLLGLDPEDWRVLLVLPVAFMLWSGVSILVAHLVVPGSPIDTIYHEGTLVIWSAKANWQSFLQIAVGLAVIYLTLFRLFYSRLPSWLKSETVLLTWNDLRIPALSAAACVIVGLILIH